MPALPPPPPAPGRRLLLAANAAALLLSESTRGLVLSSLFLLAERAARGSGLGGEALLGYAVAAFSAGRLASSFALAAVAARGVPYARILAVCFGIQAAGGALYALCGGLTGGPFIAFLLVFSRFVVGFGSGALPTCRAVVADVTAPAERTRAFAVLSFAKYAGYALVPGFGVFFGEEPLAPAVAGVGVALAGLLIVALAFDGKVAAKVSGAGAAPSAGEGGASSVPGGAVPAPGGVEPTTGGALSALGGDPLAAARSAAALSGAARSGAARSGAAPSTAPAAPAARGLWARLPRSPGALAFLVFLAANVVTKGVLASAEAFLAPAFVSASAARGSELGEGPELDAAADTAEFALALGAVGLLSYALVALKPQRVREGERGREGPGADGAPPAPPAAGDAAAAAVTRTAAAPAGAAAPRCGDGQPWLSWARRFADELDVLLLLASLALTAAGAGVLGLGGASAGGGRDLSLAELSAGLVLLWSLAAPVADVLSVSCLSVALSAVAPGSQALLMGYLSAGGSVGRILWPLGVAALGRGVSSMLSAASALACAAAVAALYRAFPVLPGAGALALTPCGGSAARGGRRGGRAGAGDAEEALLDEGTFEHEGGGVAAEGGHAGR